MLRYSCYERKTYKAAMYLCARMHLHICSAEEIGSSLQCGTGCGFDAQRVWTSTPCEVLSKK